MSEALASIHIDILAGLAVRRRKAESPSFEDADQKIRPMGKALLVGLVLRKERGLTRNEADSWAWPSDCRPVGGQPLASQMASLRAEGFEISSSRGGHPHVLLNVDFAAVDAHRFVDLHRQAGDLVSTDPGRSRDLWEEALTLWTPHIPLAESHPYVQQPALFDKLERTYVNVVASLAGVLAADLSGNSHHRLEEVVDLLAEAEPGHDRLPVLTEVLARSAAGRTLGASQHPSSPAAASEVDNYLAQYMRRCAVVDPRRIRRSQLTQGVILPLDDVYISLQLGLNPTELPQLPTELLVDSRAAPGEEESLREAEPEGEQQESIAQQQDAGVDLVQLIRENRWTVILGAPGSGKSTLLQWLALIHARALRGGAERVVVPGHRLGLTDEKVDLGPARLPVLVRVADYVEYLTAEDTPVSAGLSDFLGRHLLLNEPLSGAPEQRTLLIREHLSGGKVIVLLDGMDEITHHSMRARVRRDIEMFVSDHVADPVNPEALHAWNDGDSDAWWRERASFPANSGGNQIVVTSRIHGYRESSLDSQYTLVRIRPLTPEMTSRFCENWCLAVQRFRAQTTLATDEEIQRLAAADADALNRAIRSRPGVARIAANPLLLTVLAMLLRERSQLPAQRVAVYQEASRVLVDRRYSEWSVEDLVDVLGPLALWLHEHRASGVATLEEVRALIGEAMPRVMDTDIAVHVEDFLAAAREASGILVEVSADRFSFLHLTFQEFFAATELTRSLSSFREHLSVRLHDPRWTEVLMLAVAVVSQDYPAEIEAVLADVLDAGSPHEDLVRRDLLFVAACMVEMPRRSPASVRRVVSELLNAGIEARSYGYPHLGDRAQQLLRDLYEARPGLVLPHLIDALNDDRLSPFATDVCAVLDASSLPLLNALEAACMRWNRSPKAVAVRAAVAGRLRSAGSAVDVGYNPISELLDLQYPAVATALREHARPVWNLLRNIANRVDPALYAAVRWLLEGLDAESPESLRRAAGRLVDQLIEDCRLAQGADFSALAGVAYELAPDLLSVWLRRAFRAGEVDLLSAARLFADLPTLLPKLTECEQWFAGLSEAAASALLKQTAARSHEPVFTALAWQRLRHSEPARSDALNMLRGVASSSLVQLTVEAVDALGEVITGGIDEERAAIEDLMTRASLPPLPSKPLIERLESISEDRADPRATMADLLLAQIPDLTITPARYDAVARALISDGERYRPGAVRALVLNRDAQYVPVETLSRAQAHERELRRSGDLPTMIRHPDFIQHVLNAPAELVLACTRERQDGVSPFPSREAATELLGSISGLPAAHAGDVLRACSVPSDNGKSIGVGLDVVRAVVEAPGLSEELRRNAVELFAVEATVTGRAQDVVGLVRSLRDQDPMLTPVALRSCALWLHRVEANVSALPELREVAGEALRANQAHPPVLRALAGCFALLDVVGGGSSEQALKALIGRSSSAAGLVQALVWALDGSEMWLEPKTRTNQSLHLEMVALAVSFAATPRGMAALLRQADVILDGEEEDWPKRRAVLAAVDAAAHQYPAEFATQIRSLCLAGKIALSTRDGMSYSVRLSSLFLRARFGDDRTCAGRIVAEARDFDQLVEAVIARLRTASHPIPVDAEEMDALLAGDNSLAAWLGANFLAHRARSTVLEASRVADLLARRLKGQDAAARMGAVRTGVNLRSVLYSLLDELLTVGSGYPQISADVGQWLTESAILGSHRRSPASGSMGVVATDTPLFLVTRRLDWLSRPDLPAGVAPLPKIKNMAPVSWVQVDLPSITPAESHVVSRAMYDLGEIRVGTRLAAQMTDAQLSEFELIYGGGDSSAAALSWLQTNFPSYPEVVREVFAVLYRELKEQAGEVLAALRLARESGSSGAHQLSGGDDRTISGS
ncbi:DUF5663 domain-containing protein [Streptacidiphilus sp. N1-3]|uniref:DUF5663 domain-containing protein n=1 Tax=Streptacidiphilus alkalitolerans TaxID=3342712 RepID=A0ABV6X2V8_9ACTN